MDVLIVTLLLGLLGLFILITPRLRGSDRGEKGKSNVTTKYKELKTPDLPVNAARTNLKTTMVQAAKGYTKAEVSTHNKRTDCWIIIKDKVYDVTSYVEEHPGGDAILEHAGDDSTEGFYGPQHGTRVFDMIEDFYVGDLEK